MQLHHMRLYAHYCQRFKWRCKINVMASSAHLNNFRSAKTDMGFWAEGLAFQKGQRDETWQHMKIIARLQTSPFNQRRETSYALVCLI